LLGGVGGDQDEEFARDPVVGEVAETIESIVTGTDDYVIVENFEAEAVFAGRIVVVGMEGF